MPFWNDGKMKVVNGVGYESQNLSHFTSSDYWATGSTNKSEMISTGWLGRYYDEKHFDFNMNPPEKPIAVQIGSNANLIFSGKGHMHLLLLMNQDLKGRRKRRIFWFG